MRDEFISLSIAGAVGLFSAGVLLGVMLAGDYIDAPLVVVFVMTLILVRRDARERDLGGTYVRGWFVWRRQPQAGSK